MTMEISPEDNRAVLPNGFKSSSCSDSATRVASLEKLSTAPRPSQGPSTISEYLREFRHSPCLMGPLTTLLLLLLAVMSVVGLLLQVPTFLLGLLMGPFLRRGNWLVEFLYPSSVAGWGHLALLKWGSRHRNGHIKSSKGKSKYVVHSRTIEQRTEVVKGRVYIHPLPQLLDNIGYLVVCLPPLDNIHDKGPPPIVALLVDCGDALSIVQQVELICDTHYSSSMIQIQAILSTHKHHDHTAGNKGMLAHDSCSKRRFLKHVYGGAIEKVPCCNRFVTNGDYIPLPSVEGNDMNDVVECECIAVPSHTRGSIVYALRNKKSGGPQRRKTKNKKEDAVTSHLFTGDAMFSGGGGVPFESEMEFSNSKKDEKKTNRSSFKAGAGTKSIERCFSEILFRGMGQADNSGVHITNHMLVFPGHEYTSDLMMRQFDPSNFDYGGGWNKMSPFVFFEMASHFLVSNHRRTLPKSNRLLTVPTTIARELSVNPYLRNLRKHGEHVVTAIDIWHRYGATERSRLHCVDGSRASHGSNASSLSSSHRKKRFPSSPRISVSDKTPSTDLIWNMDHVDFNKPVFTTVYSSDLDEIISSLKTGTITPVKAANRLANMQFKLEQRTVQRRPVPGAISTEKNMFLGLVALAVLASPPSAMTVSDAEIMNMARPANVSDRILVSKQRLIAVLGCLNLLPLGEDGVEFTRSVDCLWKEARIENDLENSTVSRTDLETRSRRQSAEHADSTATHSDQSNHLNMETFSSPSSQDPCDLIELGVLKLTLYMIAYNQKSWFSKICKPCGGASSAVAGIRKSSSRMKLKRSNGELVRHDPPTCPMCCGVIGCPAYQEEPDDEEYDYEEEDEQREVEIYDSFVEGDLKPAGFGSMVPSNESIEMEAVNLTTGGTRSRGFFKKSPK